MSERVSNLFEGLKTVGHVTGPLPFIVRHGKSPKDTRIVTIVDNSFLTFTSNLTLIEVSVQHEYDIKVILADNHYVYSTSGRSIFQWGRGSKRLVQRLDNGHQSDVTMVCKLASDRLISIDEDNILFNWNLMDKGILNIINFDEDSFKISALCRPTGYRDKCLIGSEQGSLELWNVPNEECLHKFTGWDAPVNCLVQSPVLDVVAIGLSDGHVYVHNIRYDETVMKIYQDYGKITSMSFRLDDQPYLVTASESGHLMVWNLERKRLSTQIRNAHCGPISKCQFIMNESLLVTSGLDNSLKIWSMDMSDGGGTLLHQRSGHCGPPNFIRFYGSKGFNLLSAGQDSTIKMFHLYTERMNRNFGTARLKPKSKRTKDRTLVERLPPITRFATALAKEKQWDNIAACHKDTNLVTIWSYDKCSMGEHIIQQKTFDKHLVASTCVAITNCGNYVLIGFSNGLLFKYNIQSGLFRQYYESVGLSEHRAHDGHISGVALDSLDIMLISCGHDRRLRIWNFKTASPLHDIELSLPIKRLEIHRENNLVVVALEDGTMEIFDLETKAIVRRFSSGSPVIDLTFSPDSRWLIAAHDDKCVRTWDLSLGKLIDAFRLKTKCISLSMSSTGEFLATAHEHSLGINIWCNFTIYRSSPLKPISPDEAPILLDMPFVLSDEPVLSEDKESEDQTMPVIESESTIPKFVSPDQLHRDLITLSGLSSSRWKNLLNLDDTRREKLIQEEEERKRNRPIKVPFFIPVREGLKPELDINAIKSLNATNQNRDGVDSKIHELRLLSPLAQLLVDCGKRQEFEEFLVQLKELGPSAVDFEIRSFGKDSCGSVEPMLSFLDAVQCNLNSNVDYELTCSWLALFLKAHSDIVHTDEKLKQRCSDLLETVKTNWNRLNDEYNQIFCVLNFVRSSIL